MFYKLCKIGTGQVLDYFYICYWDSEQETVLFEHTESQVILSDGRRETKIYSDKIFERPTFDVVEKARRWLEDKIFQHLAENNEFCQSDLMLYMKAEDKAKAFDFSPYSPIPYGVIVSNVALVTYLNSGVTTGDPFQDWLIAADLVCDSLYALSLDDLPDIDYHALFVSGASPETAVKEAFHNADFDLDEWWETINYVEGGDLCEDLEEWE